MAPMRWRKSISRVNEFFDEYLSEINEAYLRGDEDDLRRDEAWHRDKKY